MVMHSFSSLRIIKYEVCERKVLMSNLLLNENTTSDGCWKCWTGFVACAFVRLRVCTFTQCRRCMSAMCASLLQCWEGGLGGVTLLRGWGGCGTRNCGKNHKDKQRFKWVQRPGGGQRSDQKKKKRPPRVARTKQEEGKDIFCKKKKKLNHTYFVTHKSNWYGDVVLVLRIHNWADDIKRKTCMRVKLLFRKRQ